MNSLKCPECGLVNFASASECKRCHAKFHHPDPISETSRPDADQLPINNRPDESTSSKPSPLKNQSFSPATWQSSRAQPQRLNAIMILFAVYLLLCVPVLAIQSIQLFVLTHTRAWTLLTDPNQMIYVPGFWLSAYVGMFLKILGILASLLLLIPLFARWSSFLTLVRVYLVVGMIYFIVEAAGGLSFRYALTQRLTIDSKTGPMLDGMYWSSIFQIVGFFVTFIWFRYFTTSDRVKKTFTK